MTDRLASTYNPDYDIDYEVGQQGELFVTRIRDALRTERVEVKTDVRAADTGRVYLEVQCKRRDGWHPSGIATTKAEVWCHLVSTEVAIAAPVARVREVARHCWGQGDRFKGACRRGSHPTEGVVVPVALFISLLANGIPAPPPPAPREPGLFDEQVNGP